MIRMSLFFNMRVKSRRPMAEPGGYDVKKLYSGPEAAATAKKFREELLASLPDPNDLSISTNTLREKAVEAASDTLMSVVGKKNSQHERPPTGNRKQEQTNMTKDSTNTAQRWGSQNSPDPPATRTPTPIRNCTAPRRPP